MLRAFIRWTGGPMGQGVSVLNMQGLDAFPTDVAEISAGIDQGLAQWIQDIPPSVTVQVVNEMEVRSDTTGALTKVVAGTVPAPRVGTAASSTYAAGVGARVRWNTDGVRNGRLVIGTTFVVPLATGSFEANGTITAVTLGRLQTGADTIISQLTTAESLLAVWSKATTPGGADGALHTVTSAGVPDQASWLTTRRK